MDNLYHLLGLKKDATLEAIRKAYRRLAKENHPDRNPDDVEVAERFKKIKQAYDVLGDPAKREMYDKTGQLPKEGSEYEAFEVDMLYGLLREALSVPVNDYNYSEYAYVWNTHSKPVSEVVMIRERITTRLDRSIKDGEKALHDTKKELRRLSKLSLEFAEVDGSLIYVLLCNQIETLKEQQQKIEEGVGQLKQLHGKLPSMFPESSTDAKPKKALA